MEPVSTEFSLLTMEMAVSTSSLLFKREWYFTPCSIKIAHNILYNTVHILDCPKNPLFVNWHFPIDYFLFPFWPCNTVNIFCFISCLHLLAIFVPVTLPPMYMYLSLSMWHCHDFFFFMAIFVPVALPPSSPLRSKALKIRWFIFYSFCNFLLSDFWFWRFEVKLSYMCCNKVSDSLYWSQGREVRCQIWMLLEVSKADRQRPRERWNTCTWTIKYIQQKYKYKYGLHAYKTALPRPNQTNCVHRIRSTHMSFTF